MNPEKKIKDLEEEIVELKKIITEQNKEINEFKQFKPYCPPEQDFNFGHTIHHKH
jgi:hypothetical protein